MSKRKSTVSGFVYQDSFGNVSPTGSGAIDLSVYPPAVIDDSPFNFENNSLDSPDAATLETFYNSGYPKYNILMIIVDQMRNPAFWIPPPIVGGANGMQQAATALPNITSLGNMSFSFPNYFTSATVCGQRALV